MAFETGTATGPGDLLVKLWDFLAANGWTIDIDWANAAQSPRYGLIHKRSSPLETVDSYNITVCCGVPASDDAITLVGLRQYTSGDPADDPTASYIGGDSRSTSNMIANAIPGPYENYWFFEGDHYCHVVIEYQAGFFRHFGFGQLNKIGRWIGGEYYYGTYWDQSVSDIDNLNDLVHNVMFDSNHRQNFQRSPVVYGKQANGQPFPALIGRNSPDSFWHAISTGDTGSGASTDRSGSDRGGLMAWASRTPCAADIFGIGRSAFNGFRPLLPMYILTNYSPISLIDEHVPLGSLPDVRNVSLIGLGAKEQLTVAGETWFTFPFIRKRPIFVSDDTEQSLSWGVAYKQVL